MLNIWVHFGEGEKSGTILKKENKLFNLIPGVGSPHSTCNQIYMYAQNSFHSHNFTISKSKVLFIFEIKIFCQLSQQNSV